MKIDGLSVRCRQRLMAIATVGAPAVIVSWQAPHDFVNYAATFGWSATTFIDFSHLRFAVKSNADSVRRRRRCRLDSNADLAKGRRRGPKYSSPGVNENIVNVATLRRADGALPQRRLSHRLPSFFQNGVFRESLSLAWPVDGEKHVVVTTPRVCRRRINAKRPAANDFQS